ncbi:MAG: PEP-CTERM sorting domain-containing protein [Fimbriimonadaceae bacterium]|nr:PEP-CTERM sorting domain-containing protein [Fimbriimonadaceae bacterium]
MKKYILVAAMTAVLGSQAFASLTLLTDRSQMAPTADLGIGQFGPESTVVPSGSIGTTTGIDVFDVRIDAPSDMSRLVQDSSWFGNFDSGEDLLKTNADGPVYFTLAKSAQAIGLDVERNFIAPYRVEVAAWDGLGNLLGSFSTGDIDDDKVFVGVRNDGNTILTFGVNITPVNDALPLDFAFDHVSIECCAPVPEPATMVVLGSASLLALRRKRKS